MEFQLLCALVPNTRTQVVLKILAHTPEIPIKDFIPYTLFDKSGVFLFLTDEAILITQLTAIIFLKSHFHGFKKNIVGKNI
jgi:hypothetical protein